MRQNAGKSDRYCAEGALSSDCGTAQAEKKSFAEGARIMLIAAYIVFGISTLLVAWALFTALWYVISLKRRPVPKEKIIRQPKYFRLVSPGILLFYAFMIAAIFWPEKFAGTAQETVFWGMMFIIFVLLGWWVNLYSFNWKVEIFDDYFVHTNFLGIKNRYSYDEIEIRNYKACDRIFVDGKYKFTISYLQENIRAIEIGRAWYRHRLKQAAKLAEKTKRDEEAKRAAENAAAESSAEKE